MGVGLGVAPKREAIGESEGFGEKERKERDFRRRRQGEKGNATGENGERVIAWGNQRGKEFTGREREKERERERDVSDRCDGY
jgi:hypothetical protein